MASTVNDLSWTAQEPQLLGHNYSEPGAPAGNDVQAAWNWADGQGVTVALLDDGFDLTQPSLFQDFDQADSRSFTNGVAGAASVPASSEVAEPAGGFHGTTTSGDLAASGSNDGPEGVAPNATVIGVKVAFGAGSTLASMTQAFAYAASVSDVVNNSWGMTGYGGDEPTSPDGTAWFSAVESAVTEDRGGLGAVVVFAAGNNRSEGDDVGLHGIPDDPRVIAVAGINASGAVADFSTPGAGLLVAATAVGVLTPFPGGAAAYVSGTSYAAPEVSGIVAMMLQVAPALGWRDVQEILVDSAYMPAADVGGSVTNGAADWNGGGRHFSDDVGFGAVDAATAVALARAWTAQSTSANEASATAQATPGILVGDKGAATSALTLGDAIRVQHVQVSIDAPGLSIADMKLVLISPEGTSSVLLDHAGMDGGVDQSSALTLADLSISSNAFWGESAAGTWTLMLQDDNGQDAGTLSDWTLTVTGDAEGRAVPLVYTPEFAALAAADPARTLVAPGAGSGPNTLDVVGQMTGATVLDLNGGGGLIDGIAVTVLPGFGDANFDGDIAPVAVSAPATGPAEITGGDGPTVIVGGEGADTLTAGLGATTIFTGGGGNLVDFGAQSGTVTPDLVVSRGADTILAGGHLAVFDASASGDFVQQQDAALTFVGGSGAATVLGGNAAETVWAGAGGGWFGSGNAAGSVLAAGLGNATLVGGSTGALFVAGAGQDQLVLGAGKATVFGGSGSSTVFGGAQSSVVVGGTGSQVLLSGAQGDALFAGSGRTTIFGGKGNDTVSLGSGTTVAVLGSGADEVVAGTGDATVFGGLGPDHYIFDGAGGSEVISGFKPGIDQLVFPEPGATGSSAVTSQQSGSGWTTLGLSDGTQITLIGIDSFEPHFVV